MKFGVNLLLILIVCANAKGLIEDFYQKEVIEIASEKYGFNSNEIKLNVCYFLEMPMGPELYMIEKGSTGAIIEELIKAIEQDIIIVTSSLLLYYLKKLIIINENQHSDLLTRRLNNYSLFQTEPQNFTVMMPSSSLENFDIMGFSRTLIPTTLEHLDDSQGCDINIQELVTIFDNKKSNAAKFIYLSGHGTSSVCEKEPMIANLTLNQYKEFIIYLNSISCKSLFVSSCYAAGTNMVNVHKDLEHLFPIIIGNLADSNSRLNPAINFREYFIYLHKAIQETPNQIKLLHSDCLKKALRAIVGSSIDNTPSLKLPNYRHFFLLNPHHHAIIDSKQNSQSLEIAEGKYILICSPYIKKTITITTKHPFEIISVVPGTSHHIFKRIQAQNQTFFDVVNAFLNIPYEYKKIFYIKELEIRKSPDKLHLFNRSKIKNVLVVNHGLQQNLLNNVYRTHELYFQKGAHYYRICIPAGLKFGYSEIKSSVMPVRFKKNIIEGFLHLSKPSHYALPAINI